MFGECAINVTNSKVKIELDENESLWWKKFEVQKQKKSETLTLDDIMLNCEAKDFSKSSYADAH